MPEFIKTGHGLVSAEFEETIGRVTDEFVEIMKREVASARRQGALATAEKFNALECAAISALMELVSQFSFAAGAGMLTNSEKHKLGDATYAPVRKFHDEIRKRIVAEAEAKLGKERAAELIKSAIAKNDANAIINPGQSMRNRAADN